MHHPTTLKQKEISTHEKQQHPSRLLREITTKHNKPKKPPLLPEEGCRTKRDGVVPHNTGKLPFVRLPHTLAMTTNNNNYDIMTANDYYDPKRSIASFILRSV
jgi:hypothetical protein